MSGKKYVDIRVELRADLRDEVANWGASLDPPASVEEILNIAGILIAYEEKFRAWVKAGWEHPAVE